MQLLRLLVISIASTIVLLPAIILADIPSDVVTTPEQLFNCTSYETNFCIGLKNKTVSVNDEGCIKDQDCELVIHVFRSEREFTTFFGCSNPECQVIFMVHWAKKVELYRDEGPLDTYAEAKRAIPGLTVYAEADLRTGKEKIDYLALNIFTGGLKKLNGWEGTRKDSRLTIKTLTTETASGKNITYKIGERKEINNKKYQWSKELYSIVVIHGVDGKSINIVDGIEPVLLFDDNTRTEIHRSFVIHKLGLAGTAINNCYNRQLIMMLAFISVTYNFLK